MSSAPHVPVASGRSSQGWVEVLKLTQVWASLAISMMWLAVILASAFGPDMVTSTPGGSTTTIPAGAVVAFFAFLGSWAVAKYGLRDSGKR